jgi:Domain of unknown function (DUF5915)
VQDARKQAGLEVSDRIVLTVSGDERVEGAVREHRDYIMSETLASVWKVPDRDAFETEHGQDGERWVIRFAEHTDHE